jgi:hypothetical protein
MTNTWKKNHLKEEGFIFGSCFRGFSPWMLGSMLGSCTWAEHYDCDNVVEEVLHLMVDRKQRKGEDGD